MWIIKLGGSWLSNPKLKTLLNFFASKRNTSFLMVVGGGLYADAVRQSQKYLKFNDQFANLQALKAIENYAEAIKNIFPNLTLVESYKDIKFKKGLKIWMPLKKLKNEKSYEKNWDSTSDSIACWLNKKISYKGIIFIKSVSFKKQNNLALRKLQKEGILDKNILKYISNDTHLKIVGPEIIDLFNKNKDWSKILEKIKNINYEKKK
jgi:dihydroneopterin aldolase|tara:strand:+ start:359 stop:979 length:621 start_codon:yes stop_codon:yes gene_type:complete